MNYNLLRAFNILRISLIFITISCNGCDDKKKSKPIFDELKDNGINLSILKENKNSIQNKIIKKGNLAIILFYRNGCHFCEKYKPDFKKLSFELKNEEIIFGGILLSDNKNRRKEQMKLIKELYNIKIKTLPYIIIFKDGIEKEHFEGNEQERNINNLKSRLSNYL